MRRSASSSRGFSLIELMVTITLVGVLLGVGIPSFRSFIATQKVKTASFDLATAMVLARSEALKRNADVVLAAADGRPWAEGWTVKWGTTTLLTQQPLDGVAITTAATSITYKSTGRPAGSGSFEISGPSAVRCVRVDSSGIPSTSTAACP